MRRTNVITREYDRALGLSPLAQNHQKPRKMPKNDDPTFTHSITLPQINMLNPTRRRGRLSGLELENEEVWGRGDREKGVIYHADTDILTWASLPDTGAAL